MSRIPIRARLTAAFALAMIVVLALTGAFLYVRVKSDLDEGIDESLAARAETVAGLAREGGRRQAGSQPEGARPEAGSVEDPEESFTQVLTPSGRVLDAAGGVAEPAFDPTELADADGEAELTERRVPGIEGPARILARPASDAPGSPVIVVGQSLEDRDESLAGLAASFAIGAPIAVLLASALGYLLALVGLRPVEAMRRRASRVSLARGERLPLPAARDEVRRLGETLNEMLERLRRSFEREQRFVADASHELRTPIAVVKTELEGALRTGDYGPGVRDALVAAVEECDHLAQLADDLLVVARAADGKLPVRRELMPVRPALEAVRNRFADRAAQHRRQIGVEAPAELTVEADVLRVRQAVGNLVDNALRHGAGEVTLGARSADGGVEIDVADEGPGFGSEIAGSAFERFTRGDAARTRGGSGLGMAIVRAIAEAHGGRAEIAPGPRSTVRMWLPDAGSDPTDGPDSDHRSSQVGLSRGT